MGKIRVKVLGDEEQEQEKQRQAKIKKEQKMARNSAGGVVESNDVIPVKTGIQDDSGSPIRSGMTDNETAADSSNPRNDKKKKEKFTEKKKPTHSKSYKAIATLIDKTKTYSLADALVLLPKLKRSAFDESVELHINTTESGISGNLTLPHGTGKVLKVAIADEKLIAQIEKGIIDFDILLAHPSLMPKLAKVARVLGPKGLMPNPKNGTVTQDPESAVKKFQGGLMQYKTEAKSPIIHLIVGKISFGEKKLAENINAIFANLATTKVKNITLKLTQSPGIKIQL